MAHENRVTGVPVTPLYKFETQKYGILWIFDIVENGSSSLPKGLPSGGSLRYTVICKPRTVKKGLLADEDPDVFQNQRILAIGEVSISALDEIDEIPIKYLQGDIGLLCKEVKTIDPPYTDTTVKIEKIVVPDLFLETVPREEKRQPVIEYYQERGHFDKPITVHKETMRLVDGYKRYYLAKEWGLKRVPVRYTNELPPEPAPPRKKQKRGPEPEYKPNEPADPEVVRTVWESEDGRCEGCGRPMNLECAHLAKRNLRGEMVPDNLHLVCIDCFTQKKRGFNKPFVFEDCTMTESDLDKLANALGRNREEAFSWLVEKLRLHGVIIAEDEYHRSFWLPKIGAFSFNARREGPPHRLKIKYLVKNPSLQIRPQARSRNFPKSEWIQPRWSEQLTEKTQSGSENAQENQKQIELTDEQTEVLHILLRFQDEKGQVSITQAELAKELNCSPPTAGRRLSELEELNIIKKIKRGLYQLLSDGQTQLQQLAMTFD